MFAKKVPKAARFLSPLRPLIGHRVFICLRKMSFLRWRQKKSPLKEWALFIHHTHVKISRLPHAFSYPSSFCFSRLVYDDSTSASCIQPPVCTHRKRIGGINDRNVIWTQAVSVHESAYASAWVIAINGEVNLWSMSKQKETLTECGSGWPRLPPLGRIYRHTLIFFYHEVP